MRLLSVRVCAFAARPVAPRASASAGWMDGLGWVTNTAVSTDTFTYVHI